VRHWLAVALLDPNPHHIAFQRVDSESHVDKHGKCLRQSIITVVPPPIHWDVRFCLFQALLPVHQRTIRPISHETAHVWLNIRAALLSAMEPPSCVPDWFLQVPLNVANRRRSVYNSPHVETEPDVPNGRCTLSRARLEGRRARWGDSVAAMPGTLPRLHFRPAYIGRSSLSDHLVPGYIAKLYCRLFRFCVFLLHASSTQSLITIFIFQRLDDAFLHTHFGCGLFPNDHSWLCS
jgi:hypothetical protein